MVKNKSGLGARSFPVDFANPFSFAGFRVLWKRAARRSSARSVPCTIPTQRRRDAEPDPHGLGGRRQQGGSPEGPHEERRQRIGLILVWDARLTHKLFSDGARATEYVVEAEPYSHQAVRSLRLPTY